MFGTGRLSDGLRRAVRSQIRVRQKNVVIRRRERSRQLYFLFQGAADTLMMQPAKFIAETGLLSRNLVMLRDPHKAFYQRGVSTTVDDFDKLVALLAEIRADMPHVDEVYCVGTSMGAYAAVAAGAVLKANEVFAFGLMTDLEDTVLARKTGLMDRLSRPRDDLDLRNLLSDHNGVTGYHVYFSRDNDVDRQRAERVEGLPGVRLYPQPGSKHSPLPALREAGLLGSLMPPETPS